MLPIQSRPARRAMGAGPRVRAFTRRSSIGSILSAVTFVVAMPLALICRAEPVLNLQFLDNGQLHSPTESVSIRVRLTNVGDPLPDGPYSATSLRVNLSPSVYNQYWYAQAADYPKWWPGFPFDGDIDTGGSREWTLLTLTAWPSGGKKGDPVPSGVYTLSASELILKIRIRPGEPYNEVHVNDDFWWAVADRQTVPLPGTLALLGGGLLASGLRSRASARRGAPR
ncbi:MAG: PEP-CTERM sorting domain-containing protein [Burkholderiaceae bacterium]|nr:PEP-CTERM sorting domain-containing protein [Burkholderiaceae bacterium]